VFRPVLVLAFSYLTGCLVAAYYLVRALDGSDVRARGSGNAGARNVARSHGRGAALLTLTVDAGKAAAAVLLAERLGPEGWGGPLALVGVVTGHVFPAQLGFRGGKGAAPGLGGLLALDAVAAGLALTAGLLVLATTRRFTPSGLGATAAAPAALLMLGRDAAAVAPVAFAAALVLTAHHPRLAGRRALGSRRQAP
jgi:acyl phosphate:glycerol-3-phosphate acyltransferase